MEFETLFIIVIILSLFFYYVMTHNCRNAEKDFFTEKMEKIKNIKIKNKRIRNVEEGFQIQSNNLKNDTKSTLIFFYSKTCPYCIDFIPTWEKLKKMKTSNIEFESIEGDSDDTDAFIKYNIKYLPTLILQFEGKKDFNVYKGDRTIDDIIKFVRLNGVNLNTTILEGFINNNSENNNNNKSQNEEEENEEEGKIYECKTYDDFKFEKGIFKLEKDSQNKETYSLEMNNISGIKNNHIFYASKIDNGVNPVYFLVSKFIDELRNKPYNMNDEDIAYELNKCKIKRFLKNLDFGLCYNNVINELKETYKNDIEHLNKIELIEKKICIDDNYIIMRDDPLQIGM